RSVGYVNETGLAENLTTEILGSTRLAMPGGAREAVLEVHRPPRLLLAGQAAALPEANLIPVPTRAYHGLTISLRAEAPGVRTVTQPVDLDIDLAAHLDTGKRPTT